MGFSEWKGTSQKEKKNKTPVQLNRQDEPSILQFSPRKGYGELGEHWTLRPASCVQIAGDNAVVCCVCQLQGRRLLVG